MSLNLRKSRPTPPPPKPLRSDEQLERAWSDEDRRRDERLRRLEQMLTRFPDFAAVLAETAPGRKGGES